MIWGTSYITATELLPEGRPLLAGLIRALPVGIGLLAFNKTRPVGSWWIKAAILGMLNIGAFFALLFYAAILLPGSVAATLGAVQPLLAAVLASKLLGEPLRLTTIGSGLLGVGGVGLLVLQSTTRLDPIGIAAALAGALSMATGVVLTKRWGRPVPLLVFTSWQLVAGGLFLLPLVLVVEGVPTQLSGMNVAGFIWLGFAGTAASYSLWFRGVQLLAVNEVSMLGLLSPVVATLAGIAVLSQSLRPGQLLGILLVLSAIWVNQR